MIILDVSYLYSPVYFSSRGYQLVCLSADDLTALIEKSVTLQHGFVVLSKKIQRRQQS